MSIEHDIKAAAVLRAEHLEQQKQLADLLKVAREGLEARREEILASGYRVLVELAGCLQIGMEPPCWLCEGFVKRFAAVDQFEVRSFDDLQAFGPTPAPSRANLATLRESKRLKVWVRAYLGSKQFPRTSKGRAKLAELLGTTEPVVRLLSKLDGKAEPLPPGIVSRTVVRMGKRPLR